MTRVEKTGSSALGDLIRERREAMGWTRRDLAEETGLSYPYVSQLETAYRLPSSRAMQVLARALEIDASDLFQALPEDASLPVSAPPQPTSPVAKPRRASDRGATPRSSPAASRPVPVDDDRWITNPAHKKDAHAEIAATPRAGGRRDDAVRRALEALESLSPEERLAALQEVQAAVVAGIVRDHRR